MNSNKTQRIVNFLLFSGTIIFFCLRIMFSSGEISPDGIEYLHQAENFWHYKVNFPLGYPGLIKLFSFLTGSFFIASKLINILSYIGVISFSYAKRFFFPQTLLVFSFYPLINLYSLTLSEPLYYLFNYLIIYLVYMTLKEGLTVKRIVLFSILFFLLVSVRFSGVFVFITTLVFLGFMLTKKIYSVKSFFILVFSASLFVLFYLGINYLYCGFALGKRNPYFLSVNLVDFIYKILLSTLDDFSFLNVIIHKGILKRLQFLNLFFGVFLIICSLILLLKKSIKKDYFSFYLMFSFLGILISVIYSYCTTAIDDTIRIKSNIYFYLILFIAISIPKMALNSMKIFAILVLGINSFTLLKHFGKMSEVLFRYEALLCNSDDKTVTIVYKNINDDKERNNSAILLFKAFLIDKRYIIIDSHTVNSKSNCNIHTSQIIRSKMGEELKVKK